MGEGWALSDGRRFGPYLAGDHVPELRSRGLSGGGFGSVREAWGPGDVDAVIKVGRPAGGSSRNTWSPGHHHPDRCFADGAVRRYATAGLEVVDDVLEHDAGILEADDGRLLPRLLGRFLDLDGRPVLLMERLQGTRATSVLDLARLLAELGAASERGGLPFHGDVKPEHVFYDRRVDRLRLVDPAPRLDGSGFGSHTPEYNPRGLSGPEADVFAVAVMAYELLAGVAPFADVRSIAGDHAIGVLDAAPAPVPSAGRGRPDALVPLVAFVDEVLDPGGLPAWASSHRAAEEQLRSAIAQA